MKTKNFLLQLQFITATAAVFGSLVFSEILKFPPCDLCWYQRLFMFPIGLILLIGFYLKTPKLEQLVAPFIWIGLTIAVYHNLIYYKIIQIITPCNETAPCTAQQINYLGFITIPLLSLAAFVTLFILNIISIKDHHEK